MINVTETCAPTTSPELAAYTRDTLARNLAIMAGVYFGATLDAGDVDLIIDDLVQRFGPKVLTGRVFLGSMSDAIERHINCAALCR